MLLNYLTPTVVTHEFLYNYFSYRNNFYSNFNCLCYTVTQLKLLLFLMHQYYVCELFAINLK